MYGHYYPTLKFKFVPYCKTCPDVSVSLISTATYNLFVSTPGLTPKIMYFIHPVYLFIYSFIHVLRVIHKSKSIIFLQKIKGFSFKWKPTVFV